MNFQLNRLRTKCPERTSSWSTSMLEAELSLPGSFWLRLELTMKTPDWQGKSGQTISRVRLFYSWLFYKTGHMITYLNIFTHFLSIHSLKDYKNISKKFRILLSRHMKLAAISPLHNTISYLFQTNKWLIWKKCNGSEHLQK